MEMRQFPIMVGYEGTKGPCPSWIPWEAIAPYEGHAQENHQQSLERLAERGGLSPVEAFFVMTGRRWGGERFTDDLQREACAFLDKTVHDRDAIRVERDALLLQIGELKRLAKAALATNGGFMTTLPEWQDLQAALLRLAGTETQKDDLAQKR
jgi:hypothetical protein